MPTKKEKRLRPRSHAICRRGDVGSIAGKSISNTRKEVRNPPSSPSMGPDISVDCARCGRYCLDLPPGLIQALARGSFGGAAAVAVLQMSAAEVPMQVVVGSEGSKATAACMGVGFLDQGHQWGVRRMAANVLPSIYASRFRITAFLVMHGF